MKRLRLSLLMALSLALALLLCGCSMGVSVEELFTLPQLPEEYAGLSLALEELLESGYEYVTPESGENIEPIQMVDLDGDGEKSAVVFLRRSGDENPLKILVLDPDGDSYQRLCTIESRGAGVDCVLYRDMTGDGAKELIVGWRGTGEERTATVYRVGRDCIPLVRCDYSRFVTLSYSDSDTPCLITIHSDERKSLSADVYQWSSGVMSRVLRLTLSGTIDDLRRGSLVCGTTDRQEPALFITTINENNEAATQMVVQSTGTVWSDTVPVGQRLHVSTVYPSGGYRNTVFAYCGLEPGHRRRRRYRGALRRLRPGERRPVLSRRRAGELVALRRLRRRRSGRRHLSLRICRLVSHHTRHVVECGVRHFRPCGRRGGAGHHRH